MARILPDVASEDENKELKKLLNATERSRPGLLLEMMPTQRQILKAINITEPHNIGGVLNVSGPLVNESIKIFAAKLGYALHYHTTGKILPEHGGATVSWYTNEAVFNNTLPEEIFKLMGSPNTLKMGNWSTEDQFSYSYGHEEDKSIGVYFCAFRLSFAVLIWVCEKASALPKNVEIYKPGFLK
jgi:hypothetical protein